MDSIDRRRFLLQGGAAVAAAGVASAVPFGAAEALTKRIGTRHSEVPADATLDEPVVAHLRDLRTGEVALFAGHREVRVRDRHLAALLFNATR